MPGVSLLPGVLLLRGLCCEVYSLGREGVDVYDLHGAEQNESVDDIEVFASKQQQSLETLHCVETLDTSTPEHVRDLMQRDGSSNISDGNARLKFHNCICTMSFIIQLDFKHRA